MSHRPPYASQSPVLPGSLVDSSAAALTEVWIQRYGSGLQSSNDIPDAIALDRSGNVYVAGVSDATYSGGDYVLLKYSPEGALIWTSRYQERPNSYNEATALVVDSAGNAYVTGYSETPAGASAYVTVKFAPDGTRDWVAKLDSPSDSTAVATSIALDPRGFVYVTGFSYAPGTDMDYLTVKYAPDGAQVWVVRRDGPAHGVDIATRLALDTAGNVYVTGYSSGVGTGFDYSTVSYDDQGRERWQARFNSPANGDDVAVGLAVDRAGEAVVTGSSAVAGGGFDYLTVKYSSSGTSLWTARYDGPASGDDRASDVVCDLTGSVYVTGGSTGNGTDLDFATIKYTPAGAVRWIKRYNNRENGPDVGLFLAVGRSGSVYVTGTSRYATYAFADFVTVSYDSIGLVISSTRYNGTNSREDVPSGIALDANENVYVTGGSDGNAADIAIVKYVSGRIDYWPTFYTSGTGGDRMTSVAVDSKGNVCAAGWNSRDIRILRYDALGTRRWVSVYNSLPNPVATSLTLDTAGNIYVAGYATGASGRPDMLVLKYDTGGVVKWAAHYDSPNGGDDRAVAIAVDALQNVYVTGPSNGATSGTDYVTIKFNPGGDTAWTARYNGPANSTDIPAAIGVDAAGNVYVAGSSLRFESSNDYATIKYNQAGVQQWVAYYNGPGGGSDFATAIAVDPGGDAYVTGRSYGRNTSTDIATIRYSPAGVVRWVARYNGAGNGVDAGTSIALDGRKSVYVAGYSYDSPTSFNFATLKYDSAGTLLWSGFYDGSANGPDYPVGLSLDRIGNAFVSGTSRGAGTGDDITTVEYDANGVLQSVFTFNDPQNLDDEAGAVAVDSSGSIFVAGTAPLDSVQSLAIIKYTSAGAPHWPVRYDGPGVSFDVVDAMTVDGLGNVYAAGGSYSSYSSMDMIVVKYNSAGMQQWIAKYGGIGQSYEEARAIALDREGNILVTGIGFNLLSVVDYVTVKYAPDGTQMWVDNYNRLGSGYNFPRGIASDSHLNVYVTGFTWNGSNYDITTVCYDSTGRKLWGVPGTGGINWDGPNHGNDIAVGITVDRRDKVYVTGYTQGHFLDMVTLKYDSAGDELWEATYDGLAGADDRTSGMAVDSQENVYVTGTSLDTTYSFTEITTVAYDPGGRQKWAARHGTGLRSSAEAVAIAADRSGSVYVAGNSYDSTYTWSDFVTIRYDTSGAEQWAALYDGTGHADDVPSVLRLDPAGNIYVGGESMGPGFQYDFAALRYNPDGHLQWTARFKEFSNTTDGVRGLGLDAGGNVFVSGVSSGYRWQVINTLKYSQGTSGVAPAPTAVPSSFAIYQNYPNPFNPATTIRYYLPKRSRVRVSVYDLLGREVVRLADEPEEPGTHTIRFDAGGLSSGVYIYRVLGSGGFVASRKMLLLK